MAWDIKKFEGKFCIFKIEDNTKVACHNTRGSAVDQLRALYSSKSAKAYASTPVELHLGSVEDAVHHLNLALDSAESDEIKMHVKEALHSLEDYGTDEPSESVDKMPDMTYKADVEEFAWAGPIVFENVATGDKRVFSSDSIQWEAETLPWAFRWQKASTQGHAGAVPIGRVDKIIRGEDGVVYGYGVVIPSLNEESAEYLRMLESGVAGGVSVDGDSAQFDVIEGTTPEQARVVFSSMRLRSLTAVDVPAFNNARISLVGEAVEELAKKKKKTQNTKGAMAWHYSEGDILTLTAAAIPVKPPVKWFEDPNFDGPTPISVTPNGAVFGHLALFNSCHIGFPGSCVKPPKNNTYQYFHTGELETQEGDLVEVGKLTFNTGHASMQDSAKTAAAHYDNTGAVAADVRAGEDQYGIWVAGAIRPHLSDEDIRTFRSAPLSGDWRRIAGRLELVGALAVNTPGFPVPRTKVLVASGETETFIAFNQEDEVMTDYGKRLREAKKAELAGKVVTFADTPCKKEGDKGCFPKGDYAYAPGPVFTWKLRLTDTPDGDPDAGIVGAAVAALGPKGFRGNPVQIPEDAIPAVKAKVAAAWKKANPDKDEADMPDVLKG